MTYGQDAKQSAPDLRLTPDDVVNDYLIGAYELEKLKNGFWAPPGTGEACTEHRHLASPHQAE